MININNYSPPLRDICLKKIEENFTTNAILKGESLDLFSKYLADKNKMNHEYFSYIINQSDDSLKIYDCSMIKDEYFLINKSFKNIELINCGQLTEETANKLINFNKNLEELSLIGAFQISKLNLPNKLKVLNLSDTKITDEFIEYLNTKYNKLDKLVLQRCYNLKESTLKIKVRHLDISDTLVKSNFIQHFKEIEYLNVSNCDITLDTSNLVNLNHLFVENTQIKVINTNLISLNVKNNKTFTELNLTNEIEYLNISGLNLYSSELRKIVNYKKLRNLDLSWNENVTDDLIEEIINALFLENLYVFGCFNLTEHTGKFAYEIYPKTRIIGNPAETKYLLSN